MRKYIEVSTRTRMPEINDTYYLRIGDTKYLDEWYGTEASRDRFLKAEYWLEPYDDTTEKEKLNELQTQIFLKDAKG